VLPVAQVLGCLHSPLTLCTTSRCARVFKFMDGLVRSFTVTVRSCFGDFIDLTSMTVLFFTTCFIYDGAYQTVRVLLARRRRRSDSESEV
jgi:hypothetical protein